MAHTSEVELSNADILQKHSSARVGEIVTAIAYELGERLHRPGTRVTTNGALGAAARKMSELEHEAQQHGISEEELAAHDEAVIAKFVALLEDVAEIIDRREAQS